MHSTKHSIARTGMCRAAGEHLTPANDEAHQLNLDAAQRELDRRVAEGEDVSGLTINPRTYAIERTPPPAQVWAFRYIPNGRLCDVEDGVCYDVHLSKAAAIASLPDQLEIRALGSNYEPVLLPAGIRYQLPREAAPRPALTVEQHEEMQRLVADLDRDHNKGEKLARRHDMEAVGQLRVALDFEQREITERDLNLARAWTGLDANDLTLEPKEPK